MSWLGASFLWIFAPFRCAACDVPIRANRLFCPICASTVLRAGPHPNGADTVYPFGLYGGALAESIRRFKYGNRPDLAAGLGPLLVTAAAPLVASLGAGSSERTIATLVPLPLAPRKLRQRGYNQAVLLARQLSHQTVIPVAYGLLRRRSGEVQASLDFHERARNVANIFHVSQSAKTHTGKRIGPLILVDDVMTTGATLTEAARSLRNAGFSVAGAIVLARTPSYRKETIPVVARATLESVSAAEEEWRWLDAAGGQHTLSFDELRRRLRSGEMPPSALVWRLGLPSWTAAGLLPELAQEAQKPLTPALVTSRVKTVPPPPPSPLLRHGLVRADLASPGVARPSDRLPGPAMPMVGFKRALSSGPPRPRPTSEAPPALFSPKDARLKPGSATSSPLPRSPSAPAPNLPPPPEKPYRPQSATLLGLTPPPALNLSNESTWEMSGSWASDGPPSASPGRGSGGSTWGERQAPPILAPAPQPAVPSAITRPAPFSDAASFVNVPRIAPPPELNEDGTFDDDDFLASGEIPKGQPRQDTPESNRFAESVASSKTPQSRGPTEKRSPWSPAAFFASLPAVYRGLAFAAAGCLFTLLLGGWLLVRCSPTRLGLPPSSASPSATNANPENGSSFRSTAPAASSLPLAPVASVTPMLPCKLNAAAIRFAARASKNVPIELAGFTSSPQVAIGFSGNGRSALGLRVDTGSLAVKTETLTTPAGAVRRVLPVVKGSELQWAIDTETSRDRVPNARTVLADPPYVIGAREDGLVVAPSAGENPIVIWPMEDPDAIDALRVLPLPDRSALLAFRRASGIWIGLLDPDRKPRGRLQRISDPGQVGTPFLATNGLQVAVAFAWRPEDGASWLLRIGFFPSPNLEALAVTAFALPAGGPGGDAIAPAFAGLADGRWLLAWTEGASGERLVQVATLTTTGLPLGPATTVSAEGSNAGQASLALADGGRAVVSYLLSVGKGNYELWGASFACP